MPLYDLPLVELEGYRPDVREPADFDGDTDLPVVVEYLGYGRIDQERTRGHRPKQSS